MANHLYAVATIAVIAAIVCTLVYWPWTAWGIAAAIVYSSVFMAVVAFRENTD